MNDLEKAINKKGYYKGNRNEVNGEYLQRWYAGSPGIAEPSKGDVFVTDNEIIVADTWTNTVYAQFDNVDDFFKYCTDKSGHGLPAWSQGMFDG